MSRKNEIWDVEGHADQLLYLWGDPRENQRGRHWALMVAVARLVRGNSVLDVACGMGHFLPVLNREKPNVSYMGFDNSVEMLKKAQVTQPEDADKFRLDDVYVPKKEWKMNTVISIDLLIHVPDIETPIKNMWNMAERELILVMRVDEEGFYNEKGYSGETVLPEDKKLILRGEKREDLFHIFGKLEDLASIEVFWYDFRSTIFRLTKGQQKFRKHEWTPPTFEYQDDFYDYLDFDTERLFDVLTSWDGLGGFHGLLMKEVVKHIPPDKTILDVGCGLCHLYEALKEENIPLREFVGVDVDKRVYEWARSRFPKMRLYVKALHDLHELQLEKFDIVTAIGVYATDPQDDTGIHNLLDQAKESVILTYTEHKEYEFSPEIQARVTDIIYHEHGLDPRLKIVELCL